MRRLLVLGWAAGLLLGCSSGSDDGAPALTILDAEPTTDASAPQPVAGDDEAGTATAPPSSTGPTTTSAPPSPPDASPGELIRLRPEVIRTIDRVPDAFTQGLELSGDVLFESSGLYGLSDLRRVDPDDWSVIDRVDLPDDVFAEGLTVVDDRVIVLSWQESTAFVHDIEDLSLVGTFSYETQGWGLCELGDGRLGMSDGSPTITIRDAATFEALDRVEVTVEGDAIALINELECIDDRVWANIWQTDAIVSFEVDDGIVDVVVDAAGLIEPDPADEDADAVLNGIAYLGEDRFLITGKFWPQAFEVRFVPE
ncbi:MAG: glutaminyl-peptide cyclotransferase [Actinomycetota bacterium]